MKKSYVILLLIIASLLFCWFQIRPPIIISICSKEGKAKAIKNNEKNGGETGTFLAPAYDTYYKICLHEKGL